MAKFDRDQLPKMEFFPAEPEKPAESPPKVEESTPPGEDACCMQDGENVESVASQNETPPSDEPQPVTQQEDTASIAEEAEKSCNTFLQKGGLLAPSRRSERGSDPTIARRS